jgi:RNA polymerase sigma-70 factor (ECF subfamily)
LGIEHLLFAICHMSTTGPAAPASDAATEAAGPAFVTTHWSVVLTAGTHQDTTRAHNALARLCQTYWYPLYAYVRRRGYATHDAQDMTQAFFAQLLERQSLAAAVPERGRFRSFLLASLNHFLASEWKKATAQKRGGGMPKLSLDWAAAEQRFDLEPATQAAPDRIFEKQWAMTLLAEVLNRLERELQAEGKAELFAALKETLMGARESQPYAELAQALGMNTGAVNVAVHRLRKRYRALVRAEIANTLGPGEDVESEMRHLFQVLAD